MKIIIIGAGVVGLSISRQMVLEGYDVVLIDKDPESLARANELLDVKVVEGLGSHPNVLSEAGAADADMLVAVTRSDEVNMVASQMAHSLYDIPKKIVRVRDQAYLELTSSHLYTPDNVPVDVIISPELEVANMMASTIAIAGAFETVSFANGALSLIGTHPGKSFEHEGTALKNLDLLAEVVAVYRDGRLIIPSSEDHLEKEDEIYLLMHKKNVPAVMRFMGHENKQVHDAFIVGGGRIGAELARRLESIDYGTKILDRSLERAQELAEKLTKSMVLHADALDRDLMIQENVGDMGVVLVTTDNDAVNILSSILAKQLGAKNVITLVREPDFMPLAEHLNLDKIISPHEITTARILQEIRGNEVHALHNIRDDQAEVLEVTIGEECALVGNHVMEANLPEGLYISAVISKDKVIFRHENPVLHIGDRVVLFVISKNIQHVGEVF